MSKSRLVSGRVPVLTGSALFPDRKDFISLEQTEPNFGIPSTGSLLASLTDGTRYFISGSTEKTLISFNTSSQIWEPVELLQWNQISPEVGEVSLTGSINLSGSFFLNDVDILQQVADSGIFRQTGSFWATTNNLQITGSLKVNLPEEETFEIATEGTERFKINEEGVLVLAPFIDTPTPVFGGIIYSGSNEFFLGL